MVEWFQGFYFKKRDRDVQQNAKTFAIGIGGFDTYILSTYKKNKEIFYLTFFEANQSRDLQIDVRSCKYLDVIKSGI